MKLTKLKAFAAPRTLNVCQNLLNNNCLGEKVSIIEKIEMKTSSNVFASCTYEACKLKVKVFNEKVNFELKFYLKADQPLQIGQRENFNLLSITHLV